MIDNLKIFILYLAKLKKNWQFYGSNYFVTMKASCSKKSTQNYILTVQSIYERNLCSVFAKH